MKFPVVSGPTEAGTASSTAPATPFQNVTLASGLVSAGPQPLQAMVDAFGFAHFKGGPLKNASGGALAPGAAVGQLPAGIAPASDPATVDVGSVAWQIGTDGSLVVHPYSPSWASNGYLFPAGEAFYAGAAAVSTPETVVVTNPGNQANLTTDTVSLPIVAIDNFSRTLTYTATGLPTGLSIAASTGIITGTPSAGSFTTTVSATSVTGATAPATFSWSVSAPVGNTITVISPGDQSTQVAAAVSLTVVATDSDGLQTLTFASTALPAGLALDPATGIISGHPTIAGGTNVTVTATDGTGASGTATFAWTVTPANTVTVTAPGNQVSTVGGAASLQIAASDSDNTQTLTYAASGLPAGLSINAGSGLISGTPTASAASSVTVVVSDTTNATGTRTFNWTVNTAHTVTVTNPGTQSGTVATQASLSIAASDSATGQTLTFSWTGAVPGLSISPNTGLITGIFSTAGAYTVTVTATDATGVSGSATFQWNVTPATSSTISFLRRDYSGWTGSNTFGPYKYLVLQYSEGPFVAAFKNAHPNTKVLCYMDLVSAKSSDASGITTLAIWNGMASSWQASSSGSSVVPILNTYVGGTVANPAYWMDPSSATLRTAAVTHCQNVLNTYPFDGFWLDNAFPTVCGSYVTGSSVFPAGGGSAFTNTTWKSALIGYLTALRNGVPSATLIGNVAYAADGGAFWQSVATTVSGAHEESWTDGHLGINQQIPYFQQKLANAAFIESNSRIGMLHSWNDTEQGNTFGLAMALLVANGHLTYEADNDLYSGSNERWYSEYNTALNLGAPTAAYVTLSSGLMLRQFQKGRVILNPTANSITDNSLPGTGGSGGSSVTLVGLSYSTSSTAVPSGVPAVIGY